MTFLLSSKNVFEYLLKQELFLGKEQALSHVELKVAKNFNLLLSLQDARKLLVKQERHDREGKTTGDFSREWRIHQFLQQTPELNHIRLILSEVLHFDPKHSVIIFNYLNDYCDLFDFYIKENLFPTTIATSIGTTLAAIHHATFNCQKYEEILSQTSEDISIKQAFNFNLGLERISPEVFGQFHVDGLKFFALYQRYESLGKENA